jgi:hypothetical protein
MFQAFALALALEPAVPFTFLNNHIVVDVMLNGKGPFHFIFDSGGSNIMDPAVAAQINAPGRGSVNVSGVGNGPEHAQIASVDSVRLGTSELTSQRFIVLPTRDGFGASEGPQIDGLIGAEFLGKFVTTIDYEGRELRFGDTSDEQADGAQVLPITLSGGHPRVPCRIDDIPTTCSMDTGSRLGATVVKPFADAHPTIIPSTMTANSIEGYGIGGAAYGRLGRLGSVSFGTLSVHDVITDFSTQTRGAFADSSIAANIGGAVLRRFTVTLDYGHLRLTLRPNATFAQRDSGDRSGLFLIGRNGTITVLDVRPGTPGADAGINKNDVIVSINGQAYETIALPDVRAILSGPAGSALDIVLADRSGAARTVHLILREYI